ncbi:hypothetical protein [Polyangium sorediatum]|uniref:Kazal-like domain-containing protein n=1 Tax=Polyangium sorediatum TaxID=889274 RepID=A0ABT6P626_9BACT|nr:hypothetical protein [Polyangium sorediatum]MDI1436079.1 hypothetical protein [Polyangium sorediatum]
MRYARCIGATWLVWLLGSAATIGACAPEVEPASTGSSSAGGSGATGGTGSTGGTGGAGGAGGGGFDPGDPGGQQCGPEAPCADGSYCAYDSFGACGSEGEKSECKVVPPCTPDAKPVCGCDGTVYPDACAARAAGVDLGTTGTCAAPAGHFACGPFFCAVGQEACTNDPVYFSYACVTLPAECQPQGMPKDCTCWKDLAMCPICMQDEDGNLSLSCPSSD